MIAASSCDLDVSHPCENTVDTTCMSNTKRDPQDIADATSRTKHDVQYSTLCSGLSGFSVHNLDSIAPSEGEKGSDYEIGDSPRDLGGLTQNTESQSQSVL